MSDVYQESPLGSRKPSTNGCEGHTNCGKDAEESQAVFVDSWGSYGKIYALGHRALQDLFQDPVTVEEKVDGSQFSFGIFNGTLRCRSKGARIDLDSPEKMFGPGVEVVKSLAPKLIDGHTYRGEYLKSPKHNTLSYDRTPANHIIGFDISPSKEEYLSYEDKRTLFADLGLETVPLLHSGKMEDFELLQELLEKDSVLGGAKIEGVVVKNPAKFGPDGKILMGKFVSEAFKEVHNKDWKERHKSGADFLEVLAQNYRTEPRWDKAIQHLREQGKLEGAPRDIGLLIKEVPNDIQAECEEEIKEKLFKWAWPKISRTAVAGLPQFYKEKLAKEGFEE